MPMKNGFGVCSQREEWLQTMIDLEENISIVGSGASVIGLLISLITFRFAKNEFPGYGLVCLCVSLTFSDGLFFLKASLHFTGKIYNFTSNISGIIYVMIIIDLLIDGLID